MREAMGRAGGHSSACTCGLIALAFCLLTACAPAPVREQPGVASLPPVSSGGEVGDEIALRAIALIGVPYRYGGADLDGFDCSGLVHYIHAELGLPVPRTAAQQQQSAAAVDRHRLAPGDLLFFRTTGRRISHVGIYVGEDRFVHAPQTGRLIELRALSDDYYGPRLVSAGRFYTGG